MNLRTGILVLAIGLAAASVRAQPPNILLILADDMGYGDAGVQGCKQFETPHIDSIARGGVRLTNGYVSNSVCAPSRAGLLTGRIDIGFEANLPADPEIGLDPDLDTMADMLKRAGYATACIGKWHLGKMDRFYPTARGFDTFCGLRGGSRSYWYEEDGDDAAGSAKAIEINGTRVRFEGYLTDYFTDQAIERIESHTTSAPGQPFFLYLSYTAPHAPMHAKPELIKRFEHIPAEKRRIYAAMMTSLDDGIGRVLQCLKDQGVFENTLIVFLSDNGGPTFANGSNNGPLKGRKGTLWEGGVRVPFMVQWASRIPAGQVRDDAISSLDLVPTFAAAAGTDPLPGAAGLDILPLLEGSASQLAERIFYWRRAQKVSCALRAGTYKWVANRNSGEEWLTDLSNDIGERNNLLNQLPDVADTLRTRYAEWEASIPDPAFASDWNAKKQAELDRQLKAHGEK